MVSFGVHVTVGVLVDTPFVAQAASVSNVEPATGDVISVISIELIVVTVACVAILAVVILSAFVDSSHTLQLLKFVNAAEAALPITISLAFTVRLSLSIASTYTPLLFCTIRYFPFAPFTSILVPFGLMTASSVPADAYLKV